jgi:PQQ-dependent dehydrogenase (methanol/ethanol family)
MGTCASGRTLVAASAFIFVLGCSSGESPAPATGGTAAAHPTAAIDDARLRDADADAANWLMYGRTHDGHRFSPLEEINENNVGELGLAWSVELDTTRGLEATPLVVDGVLYTTGSWSVVYAIDAGTGELLWTYDPEVPRARVAFFVCCDVVNRGVALYRGKVYVGTIDGRLVALDASTGRPAWTVQTTDIDKPYVISGYPRIANGKVLIGNAGAEFGVRGYVTAYDAETGAQAWRVFTVPGDPALGFESAAMERATETWSGEWWAAGGGGTVWEGIVYDPELDYVYFGTGNPTAWYRALRGDGPQDNLYAASILAVRASDGEQMWHFQSVPGDNWDYDADQPLMFANLTIDGQQRRVIMQAQKNGFFYVLDRATGEFISGTPFVDGISWATGLDPETGRPIESPTAYDGVEAVVVSPGPGGAHNWEPMAFSPVTGLVYTPAKVGTQMLHAPNADWMYDKDTYNLGMDYAYSGPRFADLLSKPPATGELLAWNPVEQRAAWRASYPVVAGGGVLATAGNLVFQGRADGIIAAYRATDGTKLWEFDAATGIMAPPVTYLVDGVQHVTVMVGWGGSDGLMNAPGLGAVKHGYGRVVTFKLGGTAALAPRPFGHTEPPAPAITLDSTPEQIAAGAGLYSANCFACHGVGAVAGALPDLRYATAEVHAQWDAIVLGGARAPLGMPAFADRLSAEQVRAIQAYVLSRAAESQAPQ